MDTPADFNSPSPPAALYRDEEFRILVNTVKEYAIFMIDPEGVIKTWNEGARYIKGYDADEIIGKHISVFYTREEIAQGAPGYNLKMAREKGRFENESWRVRKDGT